MANHGTYLARRMHPRRAALLAAIEAEGGAWPTSRAWHFYQATGLAPGRGTARRDLRYLARTGHLAPSDGTDRAYTHTGDTT